jgi:hypothetical protein
VESGASCGRNRTVETGSVVGLSAWAEVKDHEASIRVPARLNVGFRWIVVATVYAAASAGRVKDCWSMAASFRVYSSPSRWMVVLALEYSTNPAWPAPSLTRGKAP